MSETFRILQEYHAGSADPSARKWTIYCPAHERREKSTPSAVLFNNPNGKLGMYCSAGCSFEEMRLAAGHLLDDVPQTSTSRYQSAFKPKIVDHNPTLDRAKKAHNAFEGAGYGAVANHPYAEAKGIAHDFGAARIRFEFFGRPNVDCLCIPMHSLDGEFRGVQLIADDSYPVGKHQLNKQTLGNRGFKVLGTPEDAPAIHYCEGWATAYAISQMYPGRFGCVVAFGELNAAGVTEIQRQFDRDVIAHPDFAWRGRKNMDANDLWLAEADREYMNRLQLGRELQQLLVRGFA